MLNDLTSEWLKRKLLGKRPGASASWGEDVSVADMFANASDKVDKANVYDGNNQAMAKAKESAKAGAVSANEKIAADRRAAANVIKPVGNQSAPKIAAVSDRYQGVYDQSIKDLNEYNSKHFSNGMSGEGGSESMAAYNSPERGSLIRQSRQAFRLLQGGSFADKSNIKAEERAKNAAQAQSAMADVAYKQNLGNTAVANANTNINAENRKQHESITAERYLLGDSAKKKKKDIDLNDIYSLFPQ